MKIALCQLDPIVGDFDGNRQMIESAAMRARRAGAQLAVFSELVVCGYPPEDLLLRRGFLRAHDRALHELAANVPPDIGVLVGCIATNDAAASRGGRTLFNAAALLEDGIARIVARKSLLPTYDIFDELRYFEPFDRPEENTFAFGGFTIGVTICEDAWNDEEFFAGRRLYAIDPVERLVGAGANLLINISASPWSRSRDSGHGKERYRYEMLRASVRRHGVPMVFVNQVGGNVGAQFDGGSVAIGQDGVAAEPVFFGESFQVVDTEAAWDRAPAERDLRELQHLAIVQGIRDYARKFGFTKAVLGLSGGVDSALTAALAVDALGAENVTGLAMPSRFSSAHSLEDARALAHNLGMALHELPIAGLQDAYATALADVFAGTEPGVTEENLQARMRGALLMAFANKFGPMLLTTGNKSETAVGYATQYGDMCGALAPIADLWKTEVWELARWLNRERERIPARSIEKAPSAELRPGQLDTDSLPPYDRLDPVLALLIEQDLPVDEVAERTGMPRDEVACLFRMVQQTEFKRFQYAPTVRVSERCWGGRRMPVSHRFVRE
jgi:NAD+ synthetase